jgi:hypothetical protein
MNRSKKMWGAIAAGVIFLLALIKTWPLPLEPNVSDSLKLYAKYLMGEPTRISDLLGTVDLACAVGPYDSYRDARFAGLLTEGQIVAAQAALEKRNLVSSGDNRFFLVGFRGEAVAATYVSNLFNNLHGLHKKPATSLDCASGDGLVLAEKSGDIIAIKLIK